MTSEVISTDILTGSVWDSTGSDQFVLLLEDVNAISSEVSGSFQIDHAGVDAQVFGFLANTASNTVFFEGSGDDSSLYVGQTGTVSSLTASSGVSAIYSIADDTDIVNDGTIIGGTGIFIDGDNGFIENNGTIRTTSDDDTTISISIAAISLGAASTFGTATSHTVINYGLISGLEYSIVNSDGNFRKGNSSANIENHGTLQGAVELGDLADTLKNTGTVYGDVAMGDAGDLLVNSGLIDGATSLGGGNDRYNGKRSDDGHDVAGGSGNDVLMGGDGDDMLSGDKGKDTINGGGGDDTIVNNRGDDLLLGASGDDEITGGQDSDTLGGGRGDDTLTGGAGGDRINGGKGDDVLTGDGGSDRFLFKGDFGNDTITDFNALSGQEDIDLSGVSTIEDFSDLQSNHMVSVGNNVVIDDGRGNLITLENVNIADLGANDFIF